jgi:hypothetical protein
MLGYGVRWRNFLERRLNEETRAFARPAWTIMIVGIRTTNLFTAAILDPTERAWDGLARECESILDSLAGAVNLAKPMPLLDRLFDVHKAPGLNCIISKCRDPVVRRKGLKIYRQMVTLESSWEMRTMLARQEVTCAMEEKGRMADGSIPVVDRYWWISAEWDDTFTLLTVTNRRIGTSVDESVTVSRDDFDAAIRDKEQVRFSPLR